MYAAADITILLEAFTSQLRAEQLTELTLLGQARDPDAISFRPGRRRGLSMADLGRGQRLAVRQLLGRVLSGPGFERLCGIMSMEDAISRRSNWTKDQQREDYWIFVEKRAQRTYVRLEGHHVSLSVTTGLGDEISVLPYCLGAYPAKAASRHVTTWHPLAAREALAHQLAVCEPLSVAGEAPSDILRHESGYAPRRFGVAVATMCDSAYRLVEELIDVYLEDFADDIRQGLQTRIDPAQLSFGWAGSTDLTTDHYYALTGPDIAIEYINQSHGEAVANHQHTIIRSQKLDFGRDFRRR